VLGPRLPWDWHDGLVPDTAELDDGSYVETSYAFMLDRSLPGHGVRVGRGTSTYGGTMFDVGPGGTVTIGRFCITNGTRFICDQEVTVGDYCLLGWNTVIMDTRRAPFDPAARRAAMEGPSPTPWRRFVAEAPAVAPAPVRIGHAVWVAFDCVIMPGVTIGDGVIVGARSVVVDDLEPWVVAAGNPARVIRKLDPPDHIPAPPEF
jgi:acetyltransferase-like isoleucine patch superfamily enzyme